jgi:thioredoxin-like negative regulator of GroEL
MLAPIYAAAAKELKTNKITLGKVDATVEATLAKEFLVVSFPTIILFHKGRKVEEYNGDRNVEGIKVRIIICINMHSTF